MAEMTAPGVTHQLALPALSARCKDSDEHVAVALKRQTSKRTLIAAQTRLAAGRCFRHLGMYSNGLHRVAPEY